MAHPSKGPRRGYNLRWSDDVRATVKARADAAGLTMNDYLLKLALRDEVDENNCPVWLAPASTAAGDTIPGIQEAIEHAA